LALRAAGVSPPSFFASGKATLDVFWKQYGQFVE
jgi:hypothetical protein